MDYSPFEDCFNQLAQSAGEAPRIIYEGSRVWLLQGGLEYGLSFATNIALKIAF